MKSIFSRIRVGLIFPTIALALVLGNGQKVMAGGYTLTPIDVPGSTMTVASGISGNNIVGHYSDGGGNHGFLYDGVTYKTIDFPGAEGTDANGMDGSNIVGRYWYPENGFFYNGTIYQTIIFPGARVTFPNDIDGINIVGYYRDVANNWYGFLYNGTTYKTIAFPGATETTPTGISGNKIVGIYQAPGVYSGFIYDGTTYNALNVPGASTTQVSGIDGDNIVGTYWGTSAHGFIYDGTSFETLDFYSNGTIVSGISGNKIVGYRWDSNRNTFTSFLAISLPNNPPVANAGPNQTVSEETAVTLDGTSSSGQNLTYSWVQLAGPTVQLSGASSAAATFVAPVLPGGFGSQTLSFQLTVTNTIGSSTDTVDITVTNINHAPMAVAGGNQVVQEGSPVVLSGTNSFDPDGDALTYVWIQTSGPSVQLAGANTLTAMFTAPLLAGGVGSGVTLGFALTVSDGALSSTDEIVVNVEQVNHPPAANAGLPQTVNSGTVVTLNGSASSDPDGDPLVFQWTQTGGPSVMLMNATTANPSFTAPAVSVPTALTFQLIVSDGGLVSPPASVAVTVIRPNDPPLCNLGKATPDLLWPPNHGMPSVRITGVTDPNNDSISITITHVTQDEPVNGPGDGDTSPDAVIQGSTVLLRAERAGNGNGRVYEVFFTADDGQGGVCAGSVKVMVPHSMKPGLPIIDDGQLYNSTQP